MSDATFAGCATTGWAYVGDNRRVLRAITLERFNIFDFDAYGSPWEQALIVATRRPVRTGERLGLILTDGCGIAYKANQIPGAIRMLTGLRPGIVGLSRMHDELIDRAVAGLAMRMRCTIDKRWQAQRDNTGPAPRYIGLVLVGA